MQVDRCLNVQVVPEPDDSRLADTSTERWAGTDPIVAVNWCLHAWNELVKAFLHPHFIELCGTGFVPVHVRGFGRPAIEVFRGDAVEAVTGGVR